MTVLGIGVDVVDVSEMERLLTSAHSDSFLLKTFTCKEREQAPAKEDLRTVYFAMRFAAKEAVFKALAHLLPEKTFDLRIVETINNHDGSPSVNTEGDLSPLLEKAGASEIQISLSAEAGIATAFALIQ